jgi:hypothetical protein
MSAYDTVSQEGTDAELTDFDGRPRRLRLLGRRRRAPVLAVLPRELRGTEPERQRGASGSE